MTLNDIVNMISTDKCDLTVCVFDNEAERDEYRKGNTYEGMLFSFKPQYKPMYFLKGKFANAKVSVVCLVSQSVIDVIIDLEAQTDA